MYASYKCNDSVNFSRENLAILPGNIPEIRVTRQLNVFHFSRFVFSVISSFLHANTETAEDSTYPKRKQTNKKRPFLFLSVRLHTISWETRLHFLSSPLYLYFFFFLRQLSCSFSVPQRLHIFPAVR